MNHTHFRARCICDFVQLDIQSREHCGTFRASAVLALVCLSLAVRLLWRGVYSIGSIKSVSVADNHHRPVGRVIYGPTWSGCARRHCAASPTTIRGEWSRSGPSRRSWLNTSNRLHIVPGEEGGGLNVESSLTFSRPFIRTLATTCPPLSEPKPVPNGSRTIDLSHHSSESYAATNNGRATVSSRLALANTEQALQESQESMMT